jgi:hypothetical protein
MSKATVPVPKQLDDVNAAWMSNVLDLDFPGVDVQAVEITDVTYGSACRARLELTYRHQGHGSGEPPASALLKTSLSKEVIEASEMPAFWLPTMVALNTAEVRFYQDGHGSALMGDRVPGAWYAGADAALTAVVLEDLRRRDQIEFCSFDRPFDADRMANVLEVLARLHAARWEDAELVANPYPDTLEFGMLDALLSEENWNAQLSRPRGQRVPPELSDRGRVAKAWGELAAAKQTRPICLLHSDPHIGNTFFDQAGAGFFDWQLFTSGHWAYDVVWSMIGAMTIEGRRAHERDLLRHYLDALAGHGVDAPDVNSAWESYRRFAITGFLNFLTPGDTVQSEEYNSVVGERHATAAVDLETLLLLGV